MMKGNSLSVFPHTIFIDISLCYPTIYWYRGWSRRWLTIVFICFSIVKPHITSYPILHCKYADGSIRRENTRSSCTVRCPLQLSAVPELSTGGWTRGSGRVGSRFCRILAGRVGSAPKAFYPVSALRIFKFFTVPESIRIFEYCIRIDWFSTIFNI